MKFKCQLNYQMSKNKAAITKISEIVAYQENYGILTSKHKRFAGGQKQKILKIKTFYKFYNTYDWKKLYRQVC